MQRNVSTLWNAASYSQNSELQYLASKKLLSKYSFRGDELVLDIGCGHGRISKEIASLVPNGKVIAIDNSSSMIKHASEQNCENLQFILMDAQQLYLPYKFDLIVATFSLQWISDKKRMFQLIGEHLKEGGETILIMPLSQSEIASIRNEMIKDLKWSQYFDGYIDPQRVVLDCSYDKYANDAGLDNVQYEFEAVVTRFENASKLTAFLRNITPCLEKLPTEPLKNSFMDELVHRYLSEYKAMNDDNSCEISYTYAKLKSKGVKKSCELQVDNTSNLSKVLSRL